MKRTLLAAMAIAAALVATNVQARDTSSPKYSAPNWRYRWFEGRWWYWLPQEKWAYWNGSNWSPFQQSGQGRAYTSYYGNYDAEPTPAATQPAATAGEYCPPVASAGSYSAPYSAAWNGSGSAGYGWSWGPGTAFRNSPGGRF